MRVTGSAWQQESMVREHGRERGGKRTIEGLVPLRSDAVDIIEETEQAPVSRGKDSKGETYNPGMPSTCRPSTFPSASQTSLLTSHQPLQQHKHKKRAH